MLQTKPPLFHYQKQRAACFYLWRENILGASEGGILLSPDACLKLCRRLFARCSWSWQEKTLQFDGLILEERSAKPSLALDYADCGLRPRGPTIIQIESLFDARWIALHGSWGIYLKAGYADGACGLYQRFPELIKSECKNNVGQQARQSQG